VQGIVLALGDNGLVPSWNQLVTPAKEELWERKIVKNRKGFGTENQNTADLLLIPVKTSSPMPLQVSHPQA
jgi:hypothetical protein